MLGLFPFGFHTHTSSLDSRAHTLLDQDPVSSLYVPAGQADGDDDPTGQ